MPLEQTETSITGVFTDRKEAELFAKDLEELTEGGSFEGYHCKPSINLRNIGDGTWAVTAASSCRPFLSEVEQYIRRNGLDCIHLGEAEGGQEADGDGGLATVRIYYKRTWYQIPPSFIDISGCPSVDQAVEAFRKYHPTYEFLEAKRIEDCQR